MAAVIFIGRVESGCDPDSFGELLKDDAQVTSACGLSDHLVAPDLAVASRAPDLTLAVSERFFDLFGFDPVSKHLAEVDSVSNERHQNSKTPSRRFLR